ncbi:ribosome small subunit-dependent GTPase A [Tissierella sp. Yu-01]|uniref:ribosome small subunit-dependent GTPase A n=1 Tax=Tissierella sp. Yu-01 TaxID=3035694 RepID=UPI00240E2B66|nr:ribosome small subunit-dependent GTPase A [Tissierella sp. Yu-01]WFA09809.1 ribosome small subunit-dependent GTPase A [Tissierella sp. Yu-01]
MLEGKIIKGIGGFYYVKTQKGIIESRARGVFREENLTPLVGDDVRVRISEEDNSGYIEEILERKNKLIRPPVANISQAIIVMSIKKPNINTLLLDKFLMMVEHKSLDIIICFNKIDLSAKEVEEVKNIYEEAGYIVLISSNKLDIGIEELKEVLKDHITVFAGPSGVGKSSLLNKLNPNFNRETGDISSKSKRGKHTTRSVELLEIGHNTYVLDTPGFSSLDLDFIEEPIDVRNYFREIDKYGSECRFQSCLHDKEPDCAVKSKVDKGIINIERYNNYLMILNEIRNKRRY